MYVGVGMHVVYVGVCAMHTHIAKVKGVRDGEFKEKNEAGILQEQITFTGAEKGQQSD